MYIRSTNKVEMKTERRMIHNNIVIITKLCEKLDPLELLFLIFNKNLENNIRLYIEIYLFLYKKNRY